MQEHFEIHGHRGCRGLMPENTIIGFEKAISLGVDAIELDVVVNKELIPIVHHDFHINEETTWALPEEKVTPLTHSIYELTYDEIRKYDCGSKPIKKWPNQKKVKAHIPTLEEVLTSFSGYDEDDCYLNIELKSSHKYYDLLQPDPITYASVIIKLIEKYDIVDQVMIQSFDTELLNFIHAQNQKIRLGVLVESKKKATKILKSLFFRPRCYNPHYKLVNYSLIEMLHEEAIAIIPWTVNNPDHGKVLKEMGCDGIITDYPNLFL